VTHPNAAQEGRVRPFRWDDDQALFYAGTIASSDYAERVAPMLDACRTSLLDVGAGSGVLGSRLAQTGSEWHAVEPQPAMQALLARQRAELDARRVALTIHPCIWQELPTRVRARQLLAANLGATHHEADTFFDAMAGRWQDTMHWVVAAQAGPSTFCLAGFLPPELHQADTRPAFERTLEQLGAGRAPDDIRFTDWTCRFVFADLAAAQAHFLDRLQLAPDTADATEVVRFVSRHALWTASGVEIRCIKRSAVLGWRMR
jgi:hypothetical protein